MPGIRADFAASAALARARAARQRLAAGAFAAIVLDVAVDPMHRHIPLCPFHAVTGWWCPFCGSLRAVEELVRAHPAAAMRDNALLVLALPMALIIGRAWGGRVRRVRGGASAPRWRRSTTAGVALLLVVFCVVRNLPFASALRPGP